MQYNGMQHEQHFGSSFCRELSQYANDSSLCSDSVVVDIRNLHGVGLAKKSHPWRGVLLFWFGNAFPSEFETVNMRGVGQTLFVYWFQQQEPRF